MAKGYKWHANAEVLKVIDGDTFRARIDLGWRVFIEADVRLAGINAPEIDTMRGIQARAHLAELLPITGKVLIISTRLDRYGRAEAFVKMPDGRDLGKRLIDEGFAAGADSSLRPQSYLGPPQLEPERAMGTTPND